MAVPTAEKLKFYYPNKGASGDNQAAENDTVTGASTDLALVLNTLAQADDFYNGGIGEFTSGALAGEFFHIVDWDQGTKTMTLHRQLSGTPANTDAIRIYAGGNWRSAQEINGMTSSSPVNITGVTIDNVAHLNGEGSGTLTYTNVGDLLQWTAPSGTIGATVDVSINGTYTIFDTDTDKWITVTVVSASLPGSDQVDTLSLVYADTTILPDWEAVEFGTAKARYHLIPIKNEDGTDTMSTTRAYVLPADDGTDTTTTGALGQTAGDLTLTNAADWPARGFWIENTTVNDIRYVKYRAGNILSCAAAGSGVERRGFTAANWSSSDNVRVFPEVDVGVDAPSTLQFDNPVDETTAPASPAFSAPKTYASGVVIGNLADTDIFGVWVREVLHSEAFSRSEYAPQVVIEWV